jgi:hypothetical protein
LGIAESGLRRWLAAMTSTGAPKEVRPATNVPTAEQTMRADTSYLVAARLLRRSNTETSGCLRLHGRAENRIRETLGGAVDGDDLGVVE